MISRDWYWSSLIAHAVWNFAIGILFTLGPVIAIRDLGGEGVWLAVLQAGGVGLLAGSVLAGRLRTRRPVLVANLGGAGFALPLALFAIAAPAPLIIGAFAISMVALGFLNPTFETVVQQNVPAPLLARVMAYDWLVSLAAQPLGFVLGPVTARAWSPAVPLWIGAVLVAAACLGTAAVPGVRNTCISHGNPRPVRTSD